MRMEEATVVEQREIRGGYSLLVLASPSIAPEVRPGQFVHLRVPRLDASVLRRPFSVFRAENGRISIFYKNVGRGTAAMGTLVPGGSVSLIGPLGNGYPRPTAGKLPVLVAGGYGMAALYLLAKGSPAKGIAFVGGKTSDDILCVEDFKALGWDVRVATEDGSQGSRGLVTDALEAWLGRELKGRVPEFFACGPNGMLKAVGDRAAKDGWTAWLSLDNHMGCGVGACLTCVQRIRTADGGWEWLRVCREGPVFEGKNVIWNDE